MVDRNGNAIRIEYGVRQQPARIIDSAGRAVELTFDGAWLVGVEDLVRYEDDAASDLARVINRAGDLVRTYGYCSHILIEHAQPGGLVSRYEYDEYLPHGRVLRNWTNTGQA